ncbi:uncharacterized protein METZ01_LOCUS363574, partial [marine metagenome]
MLLRKPNTKPFSKCNFDQSWDHLKAESFQTRQREGHLPDSIFQLYWILFALALPR